MPTRAKRLLRRLRRALRVTATLVVLLVAVLLLGRQAMFQGPYLPLAALPTDGIIDLHCHTAGIGAGSSGCFVSTALRANPRYRIYLRSFGVTEADLQTQGDALVFHRLADLANQSRRLTAVVVLALDGVVDERGQLDTNRTEVYVPNEFVAREVLGHPKLRFGASVNPYRPDALERLDWCADHGAVLVKWIPSIMSIDPADPRLLPFFRRLKELGLPLLCHTGEERSFTRAQDHLADPERLRPALLEGVVVIAAHAGAAGINEGEADFVRLRRLMKEFPNLYADISALTQVNRLGTLRETLGAPECAGRLVYGSDFPLINTALVSPWYYPLNLTERQRRDIGDLENPWDRDFALKQALGVPTDVFARSRQVLRSPGAPRKP